MSYGANKLVKKRPLVYLFASALIGTFSALALNIDANLWLGCGLCWLFLLVLIRNQLFRIICLLFFCMFISAWTAQHHQQTYQQILSSLPKSPIHGRVVSLWPSIKGSNKIIVQSASSFIALNLMDAAAALKIKPGQDIIFAAKLKPMHRALSPVLFDSYRFGLVRNIHATASINEPRLIFLSPTIKSSWLDRLREKLKEPIIKSLSPHQSSLLLALILGETSLFSPEQKNIYQNIGAQHLLAVSGLQITLIAGLFLALLLPLCALFLPPSYSYLSYMLSSIFTIIIIWIFIALCDYPRSAIRAGLMTSVILTNWFLGRKIDIFDGLLSAGFICLLFDPLSILDVGFLLSYSATLGLLSAHYLATPLIERIAKQSAIASWIIKLVVSSTGAILASLPVILVYIGTWSSASIFANIILVPIAAIVQIPAIIGGILGAFLDLTILIKMAAFCASIIEILAEFLDSLTGGVSLVGLITPTTIIISSLSLLLAFLSLITWRIRTLIASALLCLLTLSASFFLVDHDFSAIVIPVGQGDATLIKMPSGHRMLIDAGGSTYGDFDPGASIVVPTLKHQGVAKLDILAISHPDRDHIMGAFAVLDQIDVKEIWHSGFAPDHPLTQRLINHAHRKHIIIKNSAEIFGKHNFGETIVEIIAPHSPKAFYDELSANNNSLVIRISHQGKTLLWPGDIEFEGEQLLLADAQTLKADILKAPHHGSKTSSSELLLDQVQPQLVIYSTGHNNRFGFPHQEITKRYKKRGIDSLNTADGQITIKIANNIISWSSYQL